MTWAPADIDESKIRVCVKITLSSLTESDKAYYWSDGEFTGDHVDGTMRVWEGRLRGEVRLKYPDQRLYEPRWTTPTCDFSIWVGDKDDGIWDYLEPSEAYRWTGAAVTVYLVDMTQRAGAGAAVYFEGYTVAGIEGQAARVNSTLKITATYEHADVLLPCSIFAVPTKSATGFVQPFREDTGYFDGAHTATDTTVALKGVGGPTGTLDDWGEGYVITAVETNGAVVVPGEAMFVEENLAGAAQTNGTVTVTRGYARTTKATHADGDEVWLQRNGLSTCVAPSGAFDMCLPYVFGEIGNNRGSVVETWPAGFTVDNQTGDMEFWVSRGVCKEASTSWEAQGGVVTEYSAALETYNDLDDTEDPSAPTPTTTTPNVVLAGTYVVPGIAPAWDPDADRAWVRIGGITNNGADTGDPHRYPSGIAQYLATNTDWACGLTSPWYGTVITGWNSGDWADEYTEDFFEHIWGICPEPRSTDAPRLVDALHALATLVGSDLFVRNDGTHLKFYPKRRNVESAADFTVRSYDLYREYPEQIQDGQRVYCNILTMDHAQDVLCEPIPADDLEPMAVPYSVVVEDEDEITLRGGHPTGEIRGSFTSQWWRFYLSGVWNQSDTDMKTLHLAYLEDAADLHLIHRSQGQPWMRSTLSHRFLGVWQGATIEYDLSPYTTTKGQVRDIEIKIDGGKVTVDVLSWHLAAWS